MEQVTYIANFTKRMTAYLIDFSIIITFILLCAFSLMGWIQKVILIGGLYLFIFIVPCLNQGRSIGKLIYKLQTTNLNNEPLNWWQTHLREIIKYSLFIFTFGLSHVVSFFMCSERRDHRAIHDLLFKTIVIDKCPTINHHEVDRFAEEDYYQNYHTQQKIR